MHTLPVQSALILIDVQMGLSESHRGPRNNPQAENNIAQLLSAWRQAGMPLYHIQHNSTEPQSPLRPELPGNAFKPEAQPLAGEPVISKSVNSAFIGTDLEQRLRQAGINHLVMVGLTTNHCVSTTARMGGNLGFTVFVVADATASFDQRGAFGEELSAQTIHNISLANLHGEFATVVNTVDVLAAIPG